jgi:pimeloyl-ACP methyl ester carboxylesterase
VGHPDQRGADDREAYAAPARALYHYFNRLTTKERFMNAITQLSRSQEVTSKVAQLLQKRVSVAQERYKERVQKVLSDAAADFKQRPLTPWDAMIGWYNYSVDFAQRSVLFWDTLRQRGNHFLKTTREGLLPVLHFDYEMVLDGRAFARPVNYALVRIVPPPGVTVDPARRPYVIIDPRAGHGPGIGGFKDDSQVGVALREGHPVYFVIFFQEPQPGQTLPDVCVAEQQFVRKVRSLHPHSSKPAIIGNCQGGWAAMMLAAAGPDDTGPIVINGAPMSYWAGAWQEGEGDNPMRYAGGMLGGSWLASFAADMGNGIFDGAYLVENFESLNPANTFWDKYYNVFAKVDTEAPRFLDFERWWGGFYLMNREEIEWITRNLFVGDKLWSGDVRASDDKPFDLRDIKAPIILFASMGDNITPPQQAFNWVADVYGSTDEIKARGQVIIGLVHGDVGHLGIFVSGRVAKKEHAQIVSVLKSVEMLPPGLYAMKIEERKGAAGKPEYQVEFHERRLEDIVAQINRFGRKDEKPFEAVAAVSEFNQRAYEMFARPVVQAMSNETTAKLGRDFHSLRVQRWALSDANPWLAWLAPAAEAVRAQRKALGPEDPLRKAEAAMSELVSASLDHYRALRDAISEAAFFSTYGNMFSLPLAQRHDAEERPAPGAADSRESPYVKDALASIREGGYTEAFARVAFLLARKDESLPLSRVVMRQDLAKDYADLLPALSAENWRRIRGEQEIIARYEPEQAIDALADLLAERADRERLCTLIDRLLADKRVQQSKPTAGQMAMLDRVRGVLKVEKARRPRANA